MKYIINIVKACTLVFLVQCSFGETESILSIYKDALSFNQDVEVARGKSMQTDGIYAQNLWAFAPAPLVTYSRERRSITYKRGANSVSHPGSADLIIMQNISAPKVLDAISAKKANQSSKANYQHIYNSLLNVVTKQVTVAIAQYETIESVNIKIKQLDNIYKSELKKQSKNTTNLNLIKTSLESANIDHAMLQIGLESLVNNIYLTTGKRYDTLPKGLNSSKLTDRIHVKNLDYYMDYTQKYNQAIKASKLKALAQKYQLKAERGNFLPYISYSVLYNKNHSQDDNITSDLVNESTISSLGITYDFGANPGKVIEQKGTLMRAQALNRQTTVEQINLANNTYKKITQLKPVINHLEKTIAQSNKTLKLMKEQYTNGKISLSDLIEFINQQHNIRTELAEYRNQLIQNYTTLLVTTGFNSDSIADTLNDLMPYQANISKLLI